MALDGKGMMIWQVSRCENGNANSIASLARSAGLTHVHIKIANGTNSYNIDKNTNNDLVLPVVNALHAKGIQAWGWHYVYGYNPIGEAQIAIKRIKELGLDGYVIDAETEYKKPGRDIAAEKFMSELRKELSNIPIALCSYRWPSYHPQLPWKEFLNKCDYNMPQVYWQAAHNSEAQLERSVREFQALNPFRPIIPTGPVYKYGDWEPTSEEIIEFLETARNYNLSAVNFFEWYYGRTILKPLWDAISAFPWLPHPLPDDLPNQYITALNTNDIIPITNLYTQNAVHITATQTIQGIDSIYNWYTTFLSEIFPDASFNLTGSNTSENTRHFTWKASSPDGEVNNGNDTIGIIDGKIAYHYSNFTVQT